MNFYIGLHMVSHAWRFGRSMISVNRLWKRKSDFTVQAWMLDSGAFTAISSNGFHRPAAEYAAQVNRWGRCGRMAAAVSQDWMCEPFILAITGKTVREHQRLTVGRYDELLGLIRGAYLMPVLQGYWPEEYLECLDLYGARLKPGQWVGVGSVCKRNVRVEEIEHVLVAVKNARPDLRLHGFGVKTTALASSVVRGCLHSADSMAWSYAARREGGDANGWREAEAFAAKIEAQAVEKKPYRPILF